MSTTLEQYLTPQDVSARLVLPTRTVRYLAQTGQLPATKVGHQWRFSESKVSAWLARRQHRGVVQLVNEERV